MFEFCDSIRNSNILRGSVKFATDGVCVLSGTIQHKPVSHYILVVTGFGEIPRPTVESGGERYERPEVLLTHERTMRSETKSSLEERKESVLHMECYFNAPEYFRGILSFR